MSVVSVPLIESTFTKEGTGVRRAFSCVQKAAVVGGDAPTSVAFCTRENGCGATVAWFVKVDSIKGTDTTLIHKQLAAVTLFDNYVFDPEPAPRLDARRGRRPVGA